MRAMIDADNTRLNGDCYAPQSEFASRFELTRMRKKTQIKTGFQRSMKFDFKNINKFRKGEKTTTPPE